MTITGIDTLAVVVANRHTAVKWYSDTLGLRIAYVGPPHSNADPTVQGTPENAGHWIELGPSRPLTRVHICELDTHGVEPGATGITFLTDDIHSDYERLKRRGVNFTGPPRKMEWGEWLCSFFDPDGNEFDLKQPSES
jgi:catechol 2,3-dioxygenase-like lactoylglutathione lyase family enzyme